jgi:hypothetical protein
LGKNDCDETQPERVCAKGFAKIIGDACAEKIGQRSKEEVKRAGEAEEVSQFMISNLRFLNTTDAKDTKKEERFFAE